VPDTHDEGLLGYEYGRTLNRHDEWKSVRVKSLRPNISDPRQNLGHGIGARKYLIVGGPGRTRTCDQRIMSPSFETAVFPVISIS